MAQNEYSAFNDLVTEMSKGEREQMLKNMNQMKAGVGNVFDVESASGSEDESKNLTEKIKNLSLLKKFIYWLTAMLTNSTMEVVFDRALIKEIARSVEKTGPGLVYYKRKILGPTFYEKIAELKKAAEFFVPYISQYETNTGAFYLTLGSLIIPELAEKIQTESDPYQYALNVTVTPDMKSLLVNKMEKAIDGIASDKKAEMYAAVRGMEWLRQFVRLPLGRITSKFEMLGEGTRGCEFSQVKQDFGDFTKIIAGYVPLSDESIQALYLLNKKKGKASSGYDEPFIDDDNNGSDFIDNACSHNGIIRMFASTVPVVKIAKLVFESSLYTPESYGGGEGWFQKYRAQWKLMFERRWNNWERDSKKEKIKYKLRDYFQTEDFPLYPVRPWEMSGVNKVFHYQLTLGFIHFYFKNIYNQFEQVLKTVSVEGDFSMKDNRIEFSESLNLFVKVNDALELLAGKLSAGGEYGQAFATYEAKETAASVDEIRLDNIMTSIESSVAQNINDFGKACRNMKNLLGGIVGDKITPYYGPVVNLNKLGGKDNRIFRAKLVKAYECIDRAYEFLLDIEPLDLSIEG